MNHQKFSVAVVCLSNVKESMAVHYLLCEKGYVVKSFGIGGEISIPSECGTIKYSFDVNYSDIYEDLMRRGQSLYTECCDALNRNMSIKSKPEMFESSTDKFDIIITCSKKSFNKVLKHFSKSTGQGGSKVLVINFKIRQNAEEGVREIYDFLSLAEEICQNIDQIELVIYKYEELQKKYLLFRWCYY